MRTHRNTRAAIQALWLEMLVSKQCAAGATAASIIPLACEVPNWFATRELGLGRGEGPSVFATMANLPETNRRRRRAVALRTEREWRELDDEMAADARRTGATSFARSLRKAASAARR